MTKRSLKVARIGNSRGVRLPAATLARYRIGSQVTMEELPEGILLRAGVERAPQLSWEETAAAMALASEDWSRWDSVAGDGLEYAPWEPPRSQVRESPAAKGRRRKRK